MSAPGRPPTRRALIEAGTRELAEAGIGPARHEAERLLAHVLGTTRSRLLLESGEPVSAVEESALAALLSRRALGVPLQHLEGTVQFRRLELISDARALIPRPETEQLVEHVARWARARHGGRRADTPREGARPPLHRVLDIGTGSGAIALSLLDEGIAEQVLGLDACEHALEQARENRERVARGGRLALRLCRANPYEALLSGERFDAIVSNPPYVRSDELAGLAREVRLHDPVVALVGGQDGLAVVREVARGARAFLAPGGGLFLEIGAEQGEEVREILHDSGTWRVIEIRRDLSGRERFAIALA